MLFPTITFAIFFLIVLPLNWWLAPRVRKRARSGGPAVEISQDGYGSEVSGPSDGESLRGSDRAVGWKLFLLGASYVFYGAWDWRFVGLLVLSTLANALFAHLIANARGMAVRRSWLTVAVIANLGVLGWFKYYGFFATSFVNALSKVGLTYDLPIYDIILPVGISFFTFQALSYVIDVFRRDTRPAGLLDVAVYLAFFPQIVAGPIVRATEFLPQLRNHMSAREVDWVRAGWLICAGLFKKVVISSFLAEAIVDPVFANPAGHSSPELIVAVYAFAVQIYADFSGYTDIAIGIALLLGFKLPDNFNAPYMAATIRDFWQRWHMTLSRWLRDYLYIPIGGSQGSQARTTVNLMITMLLGGLWHGAAWNFVAWGGIHGSALAYEHFTEASGRELKPANVWLRRLVTFNIVCLAWIFFRAETFGDSFTIVTRIFYAWGPAPLVTPLVLIVIALSIAAQYVPNEAMDKVRDGLRRLGPAACAVGFALALVAIDAFGPEGVAPFIYFRF